MRTDSGFLPSKLDELLLEYVHDPLQAHHIIINELFQASTNEHDIRDRTVLRRRLTQTLTEFDGHEEYTTDARYIGMWHQFIAISDHKQIAFNYLEQNNIGLQDARTYILQAEMHVDEKKLSKARDAIQLGLHRSAQPTFLLKPQLAAVDKLIASGVVVEEVKPVGLGLRDISGGQHTAFGGFRDEVQTTVLETTTDNVEDTGGRIPLAAVLGDDTGDVTKENIGRLGRAGKIPQEWQPEESLDFDILVDDDFRQPDDADPADIEGGAGVGLGVVPRGPTPPPAPVQSRLAFAQLGGPAAKPQTSVTTTAFGAPFGAPAAAPFGQPFGAPAPAPFGSLAPAAAPAPFGVGAPAAPAADDDLFDDLGLDDFGATPAPAPATGFGGFGGGFL